MTKTPTPGSDAYKAWIVRIVAKAPAKRTAAEKAAIAREFKTATN